MPNRRQILVLAGVLGIASSAAATAAAVAAHGATGCAVTYTVAGQWTDGFQGTVAIRNSGDALTSWKLAVTFPDGSQKATQSWNATVTQSGKQATFANASWNGAVRANGTVTFGFLGSFAGANPTPTAFSLNGVSCGGADAPTSPGTVTTPAATPESPTATASTPGATPTTAIPTTAAPSPSASKPTATPTAGTGGAPAYFTTLAPGAALPSSAQCAAWVRATPIAENKGVNATANKTTGQAVPGATGFTARVDGNFTGTTAQILRWTACKWGLDEDMVKAQAAIESWWRMNTLGDFGTDATRCPPGHGLGVDGKAGSCPESYGLLQVRYPYNLSAFPAVANSSAMNADYAYSSWRSCFEGKLTWLNTVDRGSDYAAGDAWGCMGVWFAGRWHTAAADGYVVRVKDYLAQRIWETKNFQQP